MIVILLVVYPKNATSFINSMKRQLGCEKLRGGDLWIPEGRQRADGSIARGNGTEGSQELKIYFVKLRPPAGECLRHFFTPGQLRIINTSFFNGIIIKA